MTHLRGCILLTLVVACANSPMTSRPVDTPADPNTLRVQGRLTDEGVECPALRADNGTLYTLLGEIEGFKPGDRVVVEGTRVEISFCMQGTTLQVKKISRTPSSD